jgi:hypothetical protein
MYSKGKKSLAAKSGEYGAFFIPRYRYGNQSEHPPEKLKQVNAQDIVIEINHDVSEMGQKRI